MNSEREREREKEREDILVKGKKGEGEK